MPIELLRLYQDAAIRRNIEGIVNPVKAPGIDRLMLQESGRTVHDVTKADIDAFEVPEHQDLILDEVRRYAFSIVSLAFKEDNKWRLNDGQNTSSVLMKDAAFQHRVNNNDIAFAKGDVLVCDLRTIQWQVEDGVMSEYEVVRVVAHRPARRAILVRRAGGIRCRTLDFKGKQHIYAHHLTVPYRTLEPDAARSLNPAGDDDNLIMMHWAK